MARPKNPEITHFILAHADHLGRAISKALRDRFGVSKQTAHRYLRELVDNGELAAIGEGRGRVYQRVKGGGPPLFPVEDGKLFSLSIKEAQALGEDRLWERDIVPLLPQALRRNVRSILQHGFTEIVNNALDHSSGREVKYSYVDRGASIAMTIEDDGVGAFARIREGFNLPNNWEALGELLKGKRTTMAERHAGEGVFFTARAFDFFSLSANYLSYSYFAKLDDWTADESPVAKGTKVLLTIERDSPRELDAVFAKYTSPEDLAFDIGGRFIAMPYTIAARDELVSRSEARRLLAGAEKFREVLLDFKDVVRVGQAFVDEVFRVWSGSHPETVIVPINMRSNVEFMVKRGLAGIEGGRGKG